MSKYQRASDEELREAGFDPQWIAEDDPEQEGPYSVYHSFEEACPCCGSRADGWLILDRSRALAIGTTHYGDNGQCDAEEEARTLNQTWLLGHDAGRKTAPF